jgi:osmotically-inducible protein OsmY
MAIMTDREIKGDVERELEWEPMVTAAAIGVGVRNGTATLNGDVSTYGEKLAAVEAAKRVHGVRAVADELRVKLASKHQRNDSEIAEAVANSLRWNVNIPDERATATVRDGRVTLQGTVEFAYQRYEAERAVRHVVGVVAVMNEIRVKQQVSPTKVEEQISEALRRGADLDAQKIRIEVHGDTVELNGHVHSLHEADLARWAVLSAPGVNQVKSRLVVEP